MFQLLTTTECELTQFTGRTQKSGRDDVPAVSFRLKISNASNTMLDLLSPTMRLTAYAPIEGQEQLPGVELTTPVLRCPDMKVWKSDVVHEGWKVFLARGIGEDSGLQMDKCKLDEFTFDLYQGGHVDCECRVSTADVDEAGAGMLWGRQKRKVFVQIHAPEMPKPGTTEATGAEIDGSKGHPGAAGASAEDLFAAGAAADGEDGADTGETRADAGESPGAEDGAQGQDGAAIDDDGGETGDDDSAREQREIEAGMSQSIAAAGVAFFFKQQGGASATAGGCSLDGAEVKQWPCAA